MLERASHLYSSQGGCLSLDPTATGHPPYRLKPPPAHLETRPNTEPSSCAPARCEHRLKAHFSGRPVHGCAHTML